LGWCSFGGGVGGVRSFCVMTWWWQHATYCSHECTFGCPFINFALIGMHRYSICICLSRQSCFFTLYS
jgi:hypothetical protein